MDRFLVLAPHGCGYFVCQEAAGPSRNQETLHDQLASFHRNRQQINLEAIKAFAGQQQRVANLEQRSNMLEGFVENQTQINKATVDAMKAMQNEVRAGGMKKEVMKLKNNRRAIRQMAESIESYEEDVEESDDDMEHIRDECQRTLKYLEYLEALKQ